MKNLFTVFAVLLVFGLIGCPNSSDDFNDSGNTPDNHSTLAKVIIPLPKTGGRNITDAITNSNFFEAIFYRYKDDRTKYLTSYTATATSGDDSIEISIPVGTYDVLVLAGNRYSSDGDYTSPILLASGSAENQSIVESDNTIPITLLSVDFTLVIPSTAEVGATYNVSLQITLRNSFLWDRIYGFYPSLSTSISDSTLISGHLSNENIKTEVRIAPINPCEEIIAGDCDINAWSDPEGSTNLYKNINS